MAEKRITIAVDGYSSCGKSTIAKALAAKLNYSYVDTGAMYRAVTLFALNNGLIDGKHLDSQGLIEALDDIQIEFIYNPELHYAEILLNGENVEQFIRTMEVNDWVSQVSAVPEVRRQMVLIQQKLGKEKGVVMDGRDIGTTVFPDAELKLFMTADIQIRTQRRIDELINKKIAAGFDEVKTNLLQRDHDDINRSESPLRKADDAIIIDNSNLTREDQLQKALLLVDQILYKKKAY
jgi:cytidylate kinase